MPPRNDEAFAMQVLTKAIGFNLEEADDNTRPRMPDAVGQDATGETMALEVTQIGSERRFQSDAHLAKKNFVEVPGGPGRGWLKSQMDPLPKNLLTGSRRSP